MTEPLPEAARLILFTAVEGLRIRELDDDAVVFEPTSWDAHLLNAAARAVLDFLVGATRSESDVADFLRAALSPEERSRANEHAQRLLAQLRSLGLVKAVEGSDRATG